MKRAIIIVDHGSRRDEANVMLERLAAMMRASSGEPVYAAHMEMAEPTLAQAFDRAVADGAERVVVFPYFLSPGRHSREDIPALTAAAAVGHPGVRYHVAGPIGLDPLMSELVLHRVRQCEQAGYRCEQCDTFPACDRGPGGDTPHRSGDSSGSSYRI